MRGMVRFGGAYEALGLKEETPITNAISAAQSFLAKTSEIQQVIDLNMRDYKAFIRYIDGIFKNLSNVTYKLIINLYIIFQMALYYYFKIQ